MLIRHSGGETQAPSVTAYSDEEALELLLEQTPELLPDSALAQWPWYISSIPISPSGAYIKRLRFLVNQLFASFNAANMLVEAVDELASGDTVKVDRGQAT